MERVARLGFSLDDGLELLLGADEQDALALEHHAPEEVLGVLDLPEGLLEIDDVDAGAFGEDEPAHLRIPPARLVAEVNAGLQQVLQLWLCPAMRLILSVGVGRPPPSSPRPNPCGHPGAGSGD